MEQIRKGLLAAALLLAALGLHPAAARAQAALEPTQIALGVPATITAGQTITVQAVLVDSQRRPVSKAVIYFTAQADFLGSQSTVVLAQAVTNKDGQAVATFADNFAGGVALNAEFRGSDQYDASTAKVDLPAAQAAQAYVQHVGVDLPGFTVPPVRAARAAVSPAAAQIDRFLASLWPAANGWPVAAVLLLVWSMYLLAVRFVFRMAQLSDEPDEAPEPRERMAS